MMKWVLWVIGGIAAIIIMISLIGLMLPRDHVATRTARYKASPDSIWAALVDVKDYPKWHGDTRAVEELPSVDGKRSWRESSRQGSITYVAEGERPPSLFVTRIANTDLPFGGTWTHELSPDGSGTRVTITERGWVSNPIFRFVSRFVIGQTATMDSYLRALGKRFGEEVTPAAS